MCIDRQICRTSWREEQSHVPEIWSCQSREVESPLEIERPPPIHMVWQFLQHELVSPERQDIDVMNSMERVTLATEEQPIRLPSSCLRLRDGA